MKCATVKTQNLSKKDANGLLSSLGIKRPLSKVLLKRFSFVLRV